MIFIGNAARYMHKQMFSHAGLVCVKMECEEVAVHTVSASEVCVASGVNTLKLF